MNGASLTLFCFPCPGHPFLEEEGLCDIDADEIYYPFAFFFSMSNISRQRILNVMGTFRPAFRTVAQSLTDIDLVLVEEAFERLLLVSFHTGLKKKKRSDVRLD